MTEAALPDTDSKALKDRIIIVVGMPRGGTTYLYHALQPHPQIYMPFRKELHYFCFNRSKGDRWFEDFFEKMEPGQVGFDCSPGYFLDPCSIDHILEYNPDAKVILSVRDPVDFSMSLYKMLATFRYDLPPFLEWVESYDHKLGETEFTFSLASDHTTRMVRRCQEAFGDNLLIYDFGLVQRDKERLMQAIEKFVGIEPYFDESTIDTAKINRSARRNFKPLYWLMSREWFVMGLGRIVPHPLLRKMRGWYDVAMSFGVTRSGADMFDEETRRFAEETFGEEREEIRALFAEHPIQLGSGTPFP